MSELLLVKMQFGSHVYGTNLPTSDTDIKGVFLPPARDIVLQRVNDIKKHSTKEDSRARNQAHDVDLELYSLQKYLNLLLQGQTVALDMLFTPESFYLEPPHEDWQTIIKGRHKFLHSGAASFAGYCKQQANKYGIKGSRVSAVRSTVAFLELAASKYSYDTKLVDFWPEVVKFATDQEFISIITRESPPGTFIEHLECCNRLVPKFQSIKGSLSVYSRLFEAYGQRALQAESNENVDWKALMHAVRVANQAIELLSTGHITFPRPEADLLLKVRKGELPYKQVAEMIEQGLNDLNVAQEKSILPKEPDYALADEFVFYRYREMVRSIK